MNSLFEERASELANMEHDALEYRKKLVRIHNMSILCHRSAEINHGTLQYFGVKIYQASLL